MKEKTDPKKNDSEKTIERTAVGPVVQPWIAFPAPQEGPVPSVAPGSSTPVSTVPWQAPAPWLWSPPTNTSQVAPSGMVTSNPGAWPAPPIQAASPSARSPGTSAGSVPTPTPPAGSPGSGTAKSNGQCSTTPSDPSGAGAGSSGISGGDGGEAAADAIAGALSDGAAAGSGIGPASAQADLPSSDGSSAGSTSAGPLGGSGSLVSGPGAPSSSSPLPTPQAVGGVRFDCAAQAGFALREVALVGDEMILVVDLPDQHSSTRCSLDRQFMDALMVAARAEFLGDHIWISIDPPSGLRDGLRAGRLPPAGTPMMVSYGNCASTATGACLYACDILFKHWSHGRDHLTGRPVTTQVDGFRPLIEMMDPALDHSGCWQRFCFVIDRVKLEISSEGSILGSEVVLKALTETENNGGPQDTIAERFTRHINTHFEDYARCHHPELYDLKFRALASATAMWLVGQGKLDPGIVFAYTPGTVATPESTPGVIVESPRTHTERTPRGSTTRKIMLFGGVDMTPRLAIAAARNTSVMGSALSRRRSAASAWQFSTGGRMHQATAFRLAHMPANVPLLPKIDTIPPSSKQRVVMTRIERAAKRGADVLVRRDSAGRVGVYRRSEQQDRFGKEAYCRITSQTRTEGGFSFSMDPSDIILRGMLGGYTWIDRNGQRIHFDRTGNPAS